MGRAQPHAQGSHGVSPLVEKRSPAMSDEYSYSGVLLYHDSNMNIMSDEF